MIIPFGNMLKAFLAAAFTTMIVSPAMAQSGSWYSFRSKCNFEFSRTGEMILAIVDGKPCNASIQPMQHAKHVYTLSCDGRERFSYMIDEGQVLVLNDKYQHGCEAAKIILMDSVGDTELPRTFESYITDHDYILEDTAAMLKKAGYMNSRNRFDYSILLLTAFIQKHPGSADAYLHIADAYHGRNDRANARKNYDQYRKTWSRQHPGARPPELREY